MSAEGTRVAGADGAAATALVALARRALRDGRVRTIAFAYMFAVYGYIQAAGYAST